jgi:hypothetical protein
MERLNVRVNVNVFDYHGRFESRLFDPFNSAVGSAIALVPFICVLFCVTLSVVRVLF